MKVTLKYELYNSMYKYNMHFIPLGEKHYYTYINYYINKIKEDKFGLVDMDSFFWVFKSLYSFLERYLSSGQEILVFSSSELPNHVCTERV